MSHADLFTPLTFARGPAAPNRVALAPMTSDMALPDGRVTHDEANWIRLRAEGGFGFIITSASYVQPQGKGGAGQTGICSDDHIEGLRSVATEITSRGAVAALQLHHAGYRASKRAVPVPVGPSDEAESGARGLTTTEVEQLAEDFIAGAVRAEAAGFHGVELHGGHGYVLAQFLSAADNRRDDRYGGALENRARIFFEIINGIRRRCGPQFQVGVRLSPERWGMKVAEVRDVCAEMMRPGGVEWLNMSLWDARKPADDPAFAGRTLTECFVDLPRGASRLGVAGKIGDPDAASAALQAGADFALIGRAAILHHDWARQARDRSWRPMSIPVTSEHLAAEGLGTRFIRYMRTFEGFVSPEA